jgi:hypothetical protein
LTEGDVLEILQQLPDCRDYLFLNSDYVKIKLDIDPAPWITRSHWDSYLWPTLVPKASLLEQRASYLSAATAIVPIMQINFQRRQAPLRNRPSLPDFLVDDLLQHAASVLSTAFMLGWYRVVGRLGPNP